MHYRDGLRPDRMILSLPGSCGTGGSWPVRLSRDALMIRISRSGARWSLRSPTLGVACFSAVGCAIRWEWPLAGSRCATF